MINVKKLLPFLDSLTMAYFYFAFPLSGANRLTRLRCPGAAEAGAPTGAAAGAKGPATAAEPNGVGDAAEAHWHPRGGGQRTPGWLHELCLTIIFG